MTSINRSGTILKKCDCRTKKTCPHGWTLRYWADGKQRERTFRDTPGKPGSGKKLADDFALKLAVGKREGDITFADKSKSAVMFLPYCMNWIEHSRSREESTKRVYRSTFRKFAPALEGKTLQWVAQHPTEIEDIINAIPLKSYVARARNILTGTCQGAVKSGDLTSYRLRGLDIGKQLRLGRADFYAATDVELEKLALELGEPYALLVWLGRYAGLRIGESLGLNKSDVMTKPRGGLVLRVQRQRLESGALKGYLKARGEGDAPREIPLSTLLAEKLADAPTDAEGYYFPGVWRKSIYDRWHAARERTGLPAGFTPHALRDLFATRLLSRGARLDLVSKMLGHKSVEVTSVYYALRQRRASAPWKTSTTTGTTRPRGMLPPRVSTTRCASPTWTRRETSASSRKQYRSRETR
jgi:integrase